MEKQQNTLYEYLPRMLAYSDEQAYRLNNDLLPDLVWSNSAGCYKPIKDDSYGNTPMGLVESYAHQLHQARKLKHCAETIQLLGAYINKKKNALSHEQEFLSIRNKFPNVDVNPLLVFATEEQRSIIITSMGLRARVLSKVAYSIAESLLKSLDSYTPRELYELVKTPGMSADTNIAMLSMALVTLGDYELGSDEERQYLLINCLDNKTFSIKSQQDTIARICTCIDETYKVVKQFEKANQAQNIPLTFASH